MSKEDVPHISVIELNADNSVKLPANIAQWFKLADRFLVTIQGDTLILKRINPINVLDVVAATPDDEPLTMEDINAIVHDMRQQYRSGQ